MLRQASRLVPFERSVPAGVQLTAELVWKSNGWLDLSYGVLALASTGLSPLLLPQPLLDGPQQGQRRDELWTTTCFEAFLAIPDASRYWEINLAPNGNWAVLAQALSEDNRGNDRPQHSAETLASPAAFGCTPATSPLVALRRLPGFCTQCSDRPGQRWTQPLGSAPRRTG